jgi:hypothetical protein
MSGEALSAEKVSASTMRHCKMFATVKWLQIWIMKLAIVVGAEIFGGKNRDVWTVHVGLYWNARHGNECASLAGCNRTRRCSGACASALRCRNLRTYIRRRASSLERDVSWSLRRNGTQIFWPTQLLRCVRLKIEAEMFCPQKYRRLRQRSGRKAAMRKNLNVDFLTSRK